MNGIDDDATLRRAFTSLAGTPPPGGGRACPEPDRIHAAVRGELPAGEVREVVEHLAVCPDCAEAWRLAAALEEEASEAAATAPAARESARFPRLVAVAATAVVALVAAGVWWTSYRGPEEPPVFRAGGEAEIVSLLPEGEPLDRGEPVLRWRLAPDEPPEGTTYDLVVSTADLRPVAEAGDLTEPRYRLAPEAVEDLPAGAELLWQVEASLPGGGVATSPTFVVTLR